MPNLGKEEAHVGSFQKKILRIFPIVTMSENGLIFLFVAIGRRQFFKQNKINNLANKA